MKEKIESLHMGSSKSQKNIKIWDTIKSKWSGVCDFCLESDHLEKITIVILIASIISIILLFAVPVKGEMKIDRLRWNWDIPIQRYTAVSKSSWNSPPSDAYDVKVRREVHHYTKVGKVSVPIFKDKYYYKVNEWEDSRMICNSGYDRSPCERECSIPFKIDNPKLDDERRRNVKKTYEVIGESNGDAAATYDITEADWNRLEVGGKISFKKFRFGKHIWGIEFE
jgi:hypothetical protein